MAALSNLTNNLGNTMNHAPLNETQFNPERHLTDGLDFYKLPMGQLAFEKHPEASVTFTLKNRAGEFPLSQYIDPINLQARFEAIRTIGLAPEEIAYLAGIEAQNGGKRFSADYLDYLSNLTLTDVDVSIDAKTKDLTVASTGSWANVSLWETVAMSEINELYYQGLMKEKQLDVQAVWAEGDRRLSEKIDFIKDTNIKFADFGTRRRFSAAWQDHAIGRLAAELPDNFIATSNPWFAYKHGIKPIGTYAHEFPMVYAALADKDGRNPLDGHHEMMLDWYERYGTDLSVGLTDTFTTQFYFEDFTAEQAKAWKGLRHDSGDPIEFGERAITFYESHGIDPLSKTIVFSDGLDIKEIARLYQHFDSRIDTIFGWGTSLMNDLGLRPNNFVMKATEVNGMPTVKLSDVSGKHTGPQDFIDRYKALVEARTQVENAYNNPLVNA